MLLGQRPPCETCYYTNLVFRPTGSAVGGNLAVRGEYFIITCASTNFSGKSRKCEVENERLELSFVEKELVLFPLSPSSLPLRQGSRAADRNKDPLNSSSFDVCVNTVTPIVRRCLCVTQ